MFPGGRSAFCSVPKPHCFGGSQRLLVELLVAQTMEPVHRLTWAASPRYVPREISAETRHVGETAGELPELEEETSSLYF